MLATKMGEWGGGGPGIRHSIFEFGPAKQITVSAKKFTYIKWPL